MTCHTSTSGVTPATAVRVSLAAGPDAPGRAREALTALASSLHERERNALLLVASELVTNSVRHSGARRGEALELILSTEPARVRLAVQDPGPGFDPPSLAGARERIGGWGLALVAELVDRWWVEPGPPKQVVCELDR